MIAARPGAWTRTSLEKINSSHNRDRTVGNLNISDQYIYIYIYIMYIDHPGNSFLYLFGGYYNQPISALWSLSQPTRYSQECTE